LISSHVIPRLADEIEDLIFAKASKAKEEIKAQMDVQSSLAQPVPNEKEEGKGKIES